MNHTGAQKLYFLTQHQTDLPTHERWLTRPEAEILAGFGFPKRRRDWLLGRWTAKLAISRFLTDTDRPMTDWQIMADSDGAPMIRENGQKMDMAISLSHSGDQALCVLADEPTLLGCDLEMIETRSRSFEETFFTEGELAMLDQHPDSNRSLLVTLIWSAKESALKALRVGLKADTRSVELTAFANKQGQDWSGIKVKHQQNDGKFYGWWRQQEGMMMTMLSNRQMNQPKGL